MNIRNNYNHTIYAAYIGYITQAIINNFAPLLFLTFQSSFSISLDKIALLVSFNFAVQLLVDFLAAKFVDRIGYRPCILAAHVCSAAGLIGLAILPDLFPDPYIGMLTAVFFYAIGGGLIEVLVSPIVEACPTTKKEAAMSLLHSFYCWGHVFVVIMSTIFFTLAGIQNWRILACIWALVPLLNCVYFSLVPIRVLVEDGESMSITGLFKNKVFWILCLLMICSAASEQGMSQWASAFAESGLKVSKTVGDLAGPCSFAILMGCSRAFYGKFSEKIHLHRFMLLSSGLCIISYLTAALSPNPVLSLIGCALCGLSVGIMWPGSFSTAAKALPKGGTAMFALLALAGDFGCSAGPAAVGMISEAFGENLKVGLLLASVFPLILIIGILWYRSVAKKEQEAS
ncbi:MAG: MFS transporter [Massiliimalia sp.]|jgi:fucose permease